MIYWVLTGLIVLAWAVSVVAFTWEEGVGGFLASFFLGGALAALVWLFLCVGVIGGFATKLVEENHTDTYSVPLKALGVDSTTRGQMFLGTGTVEGTRVLSYIRENDDGSFTPGQVDSSYSRVFEVDGEPELVWHIHSTDHWWLFPERVEVSRSYEFYVPEGSISEEITVTP